MADEEMLRIQKNRTQELRFITQQLTPENPQNAYYQNYEDTVKTYFGLILVGIFMVAYMIFF